MERPVAPSPPRPSPGLAVPGTYARSEAMELMEKLGDVMFTAPPIGMCDEMSNARRETVGTRRPLVRARGPGSPEPRHPQQQPSFHQPIELLRSAVAKLARSTSTPASMFRSCAAPVKLALVTSARVSSTITHFACRLARFSPRSIGSIAQRGSRSGTSAKGLGRGPHARAGGRGEGLSSRGQDVGEAAADVGRGLGHRRVCSANSGWMSSVNHARQSSRDAAFGARGPRREGPRGEALLRALHQLPSTSPATQSSLPRNTCTWGRRPA